MVVLSGQRTLRMERVLFAHCWDPMVAPPDESGGPQTRNQVTCLLTLHNCIPNSFTFPLIVVAAPEQSFICPPSTIPTTSTPSRPTRSAWHHLPPHHHLRPSWLLAVV
ncbi:hypothetical protein AB1N83_002573 [Pleurotus pulmonarius]